MCDTYWNRDQIDMTIEGEQIDVPWIIVMSITWGLVLISFVSVILNLFLKKSCELRMFGGKEGSFVILGWRQAEGLVALIITGKVFVLNYVAIVIEYFIRIPLVSSNISQHQQPKSLGFAVTLFYIVFSYTGYVSCLAGSGFTFTSVLITPHSQLTFILSFSFPAEMAYSTA